MSRRAQTAEFCRRGLIQRAVAEAMRMLKEHPVDRATKEPPPPTWGVRPKR